MTFMLLLFLPATCVTIFAGKSVKHGHGLKIELLTQRNEQHDQCTSCSTLLWQNYSSHLCSLNLHSTVRDLGL